MTYCFGNDGKPLSFSEVYGLLFKAAKSQLWKFSRESYSLDDLAQQAALDLLKHVPFDNPGTFYVAAQNKIKDYAVYVNRKRYERGSKSGSRLNDPEFVPSCLKFDCSSTQEVDDLDYINWIRESVTQDEWELLLAKALRDGGMTRYAEERNITLSGASNRLKRLTRKVLALHAASERPSV